MGSAHLERELKFDVPSGWRMPSFDALLDGRGPAEQRNVELRSTYFDTPGRVLFAHSLTLRRREGDEDTGWQLKVPAGEGRTEISAPLDGTETPPTELTELLRGVIGEETLSVVATVRTHRQVTSLHDGASVAAEVADDLVTGTAYGRGGVPDASLLSEWREVEVELADGDERFLQRVSKVLTKAGARPAAHASKVGRTLDGLPPAADTRAPKATRALQDYLHEQARALIAGEIGLRRGDAVIHKTRVAVRRTRSVLRVFAPLLDEAAVDFDAELSWYQNVLGEVRDREVQRAHFQETLGDVAPELVLGPVGARIDETLLSEQNAAHAELARALDSDRYRAVLATVLRWGVAAPLASPRKVTMQQLRQLTRDAERAAGKRLRRAVDDASAPLLHRARKAAKRARYANEVLAGSAGDKSAVARVERYKQLQDALGSHQDAIVSAALLRRLGATAGSADGENGFTYGLLYERELRAAEAARRAAATL